MAKKVIGNLKLNSSWSCRSSSRLNTYQWGLNMMDFINPFNEATKDLMGKDGNCSHAGIWRSYFCMEITWVNQ